MDSCNLFRVSSRLNLDGSMCFWPGWIPFCPPKVAGCKLGQSWHRRPLQPGILLCSKSLRQLYTEKEKKTPLPKLSKMPTKPTEKHEMNYINGKSMHCAETMIMVIHSLQSYFNGFQ